MTCKPSSPFCLWATRRLMAGSGESVQRLELAILIVILIVATVLRTWGLESAPPGLTHDEASNGHDAAGVLEGVRPIYFTVGYGHEPLYPYSVALLMTLLGPTAVALRLTTVMWGLIVIVLSYALARRLFGPLTALLTAASMALSFWCVMTSRVGLRAITAAATFAASAYSFWRAFDLSVSKPAQTAGRRWIWWSLSGVFLGASIYTYMASRAMPAVYLAFLGYLFVLHVVARSPGRRENPRDEPVQPASAQGGQGSESLKSRPESGEMISIPARGGEGATLFQMNWIGIALLLLIAALVASPLVNYLLTHPEAEQRIGQLGTPLRQVLRGDFRGLWDHVMGSLPMFTFQGDPLWLYNIPGRPLLDLTLGAFFYGGLLVCLWHLHSPRTMFLLLWLVVGVSPALATGPDATTLRSIAAQPAVFMTASLGLATVIRYLHERSGPWGRIATVGVVGMLFAVTGVRTAHAYFDVWAEHRDVRVAYHHALVKQAHYLDTHPEAGTVSFSSIYPGRFHDPYTMEVSLDREDLSLRWFDGRFALVIPGANESRVLIPSIAPLDEAIEPMFEPHASLMHTEYFRPDDLVTHFDVYHFDSAGALTTVLLTVEDSLVSWSRADAFPIADPQSVYEPLAPPVEVGGVVSLLGYDLRTPALEPGEEVELLTVWRVRGRFAPEAVAFTHVMNHEGRVIGQLDRLDVPSWHWKEGDVFVQLHRFPIDSDTPPGLYPVQIGMYDREGSERLPVVVDGARVDDRILLRPLEVGPQ